MLVSGCHIAGIADPLFQHFHCYFHWSLVADSTLLIGTGGRNIHMQLGCFWMFRSSNVEFISFWKFSHHS